VQYKICLYYIYIKDLIHLMQIRFRLTSHYIVARNYYECRK